MENRYHLEQMMKEVKEDRAAEATKHRKLTQDGVRRLVERKKKRSRRSES